MVGRRAIITGTLATPAAQQTCGRVNMQPPSLNIYPSRSFTEMLASAADRVERRRHGRTGALGMWPVGSRELCRPRTEVEGKLVTESDLSLRAPAQVAAVLV